MVGSTHTENKRRRLMNPVKDVVSTTSSNTATTSTTAMVSTTATTIIGTMNATMTVDQKASNSHWFDQCKFICIVQKG